MTVQRPMSPTMRSLVARLDRLIVLAEAQRAEAALRRQEEAELDGTLTEERAKAVLEAAVKTGPDGRVYPTGVLQEAAADVLVAEIRRRHVIAKALRGAAAEGLRLAEKEIEAIQAALNAYNRELRVEDSLNFDNRQGQGGR